MKAEKRYILVESGRETGPFTESVIRARIVAGEIYSETMCIPKSLFQIPATLDKFFPNTIPMPLPRRDTTYLTQSEQQRINEISGWVGEKGSGILGWAKGKLEEIKSVADDKKSFLQSVEARSNCKPLEVVVLGGAGWDSNRDSKFILSMDSTKIYMSNPVTLLDVHIDIAELREVDISGPGRVGGNAGAVGGGFGAEGALQGIAVATVINLLTTYSNTKTFIRLGFSDSEIVMLTSQIEPDATRILLSPLFLRINRKQQEAKPLGLGDELQKLHQLKQAGAITDQEYDKLKARLIG